MMRGGATWRSCASLALAVAVSAGVAERAAAWESECRAGDIRRASIRDSICHPERFKTCAEGLDATRGTQWGEHALIARLGLVRAGLGDVALRRDLLPSYFAAGGSVTPDGGPTYPTQVPAVPGAAAVRITRPLALAEMAQVPDVSYSLADFLAGNEHCFVENAARSTVADMQACHTFFTHLGPVNSTHFLPQAQEVYRLYHDIALARAAACRRLDRAQQAVKEAGLAPEIRAHLAEGIATCRHEALLFEGVGAHYLEDAWSTGHMWQRWGSPVYPSSRVGQVGAMILGALSGLQHGWRAVAATTLDLKGPAIHDRMCLPGPFVGEEDDARYVRFKAFDEDRVLLGAGDDYLLSCTSLEPSWSLLDDDRLAVQRDKLLNCVAKGFHDVHSRSVRAPVAVPSGLDLGLDPTGPACWGQRVTNKTFYEGTGVTAWRRSSDPAVLARMVVRAHAGGIAGWIAEEVLAGLLLEARLNLATMQAKVMWRAYRDPEGTDVADLPGFVLGQLLFTKRNSAYAPLIANGEVSYYEGRDPAQWTTRPLPVPDTCEADADCPARAWCAPAAAPTGKRRCYPQEAIFLNAFRAAHLETWCREEDHVMLASSVMACRDSGDTGSDACDACVQAVLPKLAPRPQEGEDPSKSRSLCEVVTGSGAAKVVREYNPAVPGDASRAARDFCGEGADEPVDLTGAWDSPLGCLQVSQTGETLMGTVFYPNGKSGRLFGPLSGRAWTFTWRANLAEHGTGTLTANAAGDVLRGSYTAPKGRGGPWRLIRREGACDAAVPGGRAVLLELHSTGIWHWKNYRCQFVDKQVIKGAAAYREEAIAARWKRFAEGNESCKKYGCNRASGPYRRNFFPQTWSKKTVPLQSVDSFWRPKGTSSCEGTMDGGLMTGAPR